MYRNKGEITVELRAKGKLQNTPYKKQHKAGSMQTDKSNFALTQNGFRLNETLLTP